MLGQVVWALVHPNTVTDLRHDWKHPEIGNAFRDMSEFAQIMARQWLQEKVAEPTGRDIDGIIEDAKEYKASGSQRMVQGEDDYSDSGSILNVPDLWDGVTIGRYWQCISILTGEDFSGEKNSTPYECCI